MYINVSFTNNMECTVVYEIVDANVDVCLQSVKTY